MNKKYLTVFVVVIALVLIALLVDFKFTPKNEDEQNEQSTMTDYKNATYIIEGQPVTLTDGLSQIESVPGSATKIVTRYFGNEVVHDLNNDGQEDVVFLLTQDRGGSGTFFYVVAALNTPAGFIGSHAYLLGDRIAPQSTNIDEGTTSQGTKRENVIVVNFATRKPNEPFTSQPSIGKSIWLKLDPTTLQFGEVAQNFEGESR